VPRRRKCIERPIDVSEAGAAGLQAAVAAAAELRRTNVFCMRKGSWLANKTRLTAVVQCEETRDINFVWQSNGLRENRIYLSLVYSPTSIFSPISESVAWPGSRFDLKSS